MPSCEVDALSFGRLGGETNAFGIARQYGLAPGSKLELHALRKPCRLSTIGIAPGLEISLWVDFAQIEVSLRRASHADTLGAGLT